jgi:hypothetical protein
MLILCSACWEVRGVHGGLRYLWHICFWGTYVNSAALPFVPQLPTLTTYAEFESSRISNTKQHHACLRTSELYIIQEQGVSITCTSDCYSIVSVVLLSLCDKVPSPSFFWLSICLSASKNSRTSVQAVMELHKYLLTISNVRYNWTKIADTGKLSIITWSPNTIHGSTAANKYGGRLEIQVSQRIEAIISLWWGCEYVMLRFVVKHL